MAKKIQMVMNPMEGESCVFGQFRGIGLGAGLSLATVASCKLCSACQPSASLRALIAVLISQCHTLHLFLSRRKLSGCKSDLSPQTGFPVPGLPAVTGAVG